MSKTLAPNDVASTESSAVRGPGGSMLRWKAYFRMGRTIRFENFLGTVLVWSALPESFATTTRTFVLLGANVVAFLFMVAVTGVLDDVQGLRDGSDLANYTASDVTGLRPITRKPLLLGWVNEHQALMYARNCAVAALLVVGLMWFGAGATPTWVLVGYGAEMFIGFQYSWGLRLSYRGLQELTLAFIVAGTMVWVGGLVTGELSALVLAEALTFALWFVEVSIHSNACDVPGDSSVNRRTMAVLLGEQRHRFLLCGVVILGWVWMALALFVGWLPAPFAVAFVVVLILQIQQFRVGAIQRSYLQARAIGFRVIRFGTPALFVANLLVRHG